MKAKQASVTLWIVSWQSPAGLELLSTPEQIRSKQCPLERHKGHQDLVVDVDDDGDGDDSSGVMPAIITFITSHAESGERES